MAGFFDWLLTDPAGADPGYLAQLLGLARPAPASQGTSSAGAGTLLGGSPLGNALRGGLAGMASAAGRQGFANQLTAGLMGGSQFDQQRRQRAFQNAKDEAHPGKTASAATEKETLTPGTGAATGAQPQSRFALGAEDLNQLLGATQKTLPGLGGTDGASPYGEPLGAAVAGPGAAGAGTLMVKDAAGALRPLDSENEVVLLDRDGMPKVFRRQDKTGLSLPDAVAQILGYWTPPR